MPSRYHDILEKEKRWRRQLYRLFPNYQFSNDLYEALIKERLSAGGIWIDLGCGRNELVQELASGGVFAVGLDVSRHPDLDLRARPFMKADVCRLPLRDGSAHLLTGNMLFEHLPDPLCVLQEMRRALKPGGWIVLRTPNALHPLNLMLRLISERMKLKLLQRIYGISMQDIFPTYYRANLLGSLHRLCRRAGLDNVRICPVEDVHTAFGIFFFISLAYYLWVKITPLAFMRGNFVVLARKV